MRYIMWYLLAINIVTFFLYGIDKQKARKKRWRIPEATLLSMAALGGSVGACVGMQIFRHKTQKPKFYIGVPVISFVAGWNCDICLFEVGDKTPTFL